MVGPGSHFRLHEGVLHWRVGARAGALKLSDVTAVRLAYRPGQLGSPTFEAVVKARGGLSLRIGSMSRTSITKVENHDAAYVAFLRALHAGLAPHAGRIRFEAGLPRWRWWLMAGLGALTVAGLAAVLFHAVTARDWPLAALLLILCPTLGWPALETLRRNTPALYRPGDLPALLIPS